MVFVDERFWKANEENIIIPQSVRARENEIAS
jgi:hypothetical protein